MSLNMWQRAVAVLTVLMVFAFVGRAEGASIGGFWINVSGGGTSFKINDGGAGDLDVATNNEIEFPPLTAVGSAYCINPIDPTKPIATATAAGGGYKLTLTNVEIVAKSDNVIGVIQLGGMWTHAAFSGNLGVNLDGTATTTSTSDGYSMSASSTVHPPTSGGPEAATSLSGTGTGPFSSSATTPMTLAAGTHQVLFTMGFSIEKAGTTLFLPNSGDSIAIPYAVPAPGAGVAGLGLMGLIGGRRRKR